MGQGSERRHIRSIPRGLLGVLALTLAGCSTAGYYAQSIAGHLDLMARRQPIPELLADPETPEPLRSRLALVERLRIFAAHELHLPVGNAYSSFADLDRSHLVWTVVATPALSLEPQSWCFPVAGCVNYRGYFSRERAERFAAGLHARGLDVFVGGVGAYSTLGWFDDPVPSTVIHYPEHRLAGLIFHELAHRRLYVPGDTQFSESFAVAVETEGLCRWLAQPEQASQRAAYLRDDSRRQAFLALVLETRRELSALYESGLPEAEQRRRKQAIFARMGEAYAALRESWGGDGSHDGWFRNGFDNARIAALVTYHDLVPGFRAMLAARQGDLLAFYLDAEELAAVPRSERRRQLHSGSTPAGAGDCLTDAPSLSARVTL